MSYHIDNYGHLRNNKTKEFQHREIMRPIILDALEELFPKEKWVVHHIDGLPSNNDLFNLEVMKHGEHSIIHNKGRILSDDHKNKIRDGVTKTERRIVKHGFVNGKQNYILKEGSQTLKSSINKEKLEAIL